MMKKLKMNKLEVQSFVTTEEKNEIRGGQITLECLSGIYPTLPLKACVSNLCSIECIALPTHNVGICYTLTCDE